jgi:hypothetical protein
LSSRHASRAARFAVAALLCVLLPVVASSPAGASTVDDYADYVGQTTCARAPLPGTEFLMAWLLRQYPGTTSASMLRPCDGGSVSEHKDGRALDWAVDAADPAQHALADDLLARLFATDRHGNANALARRMGIMYVIFDDTIYRAYDQAAPFSPQPYLSSSCRTARTCSKTLRHRDHVHISLSWSGASAQTSFYRDRGVPSVPVLYPGTRQLDPVATAVARVDVPATGETVATPFKTTRGTTYRVVADGLYRYGAGSRIGDAACVWGGRGWVPSEAGLLVNGRSPWESDCDGEHTHVGSFTAHRTGRLHLRVGDDSGADNAGTLSFFILREDIRARSVADDLPTARHRPRLAKQPGPAARRLRKEVVDLSGRARRGRLTEGSLKRGARYRVVVTGLARSGETAFDGNCVAYAGRFRPQHTLDLTRPEADHLSVFVDGEPLDLRVPGAERACAPRQHRYVGWFRAPVRGEARVRVWDPFAYADNTGSLRVRLVRR